MDQAERATAARRGRPRKWASEAERRAHEAAKRRLRNKSSMTLAEFNDVRSLTQLADGLQRQVAELKAELLELRQRYEEVSWENEVLQHRLARALEPPRLSPPTMPAASVGMNRAQRRAMNKRRR